MLKTHCLLSAALLACAIAALSPHPASAFDPSTVPGLSAWLRSDTGVTTAGTSVTAWQDQSGAGNNATPGATAPVVASGGVNFGGANVINFSNSATALLNLPSASSLGIVNNDYEIFVVGRTASPAVQFLTAGTDALGHYETHINGASGLRGISNNVLLDVGNNGSLANNLPNIFSMRVGAGGTGYARANGVDSPGVAGAISALNSTNVRLGLRANDSLGLDGDIAEVLVFNRALNVGERSQVESYLQSQWQPFRLTQVGPTGSTAPDNLALQPGATAFAKDLIAGGAFPAHDTIDNVNDGLYGNDNSWIGDSANSFVGVDLDGEFYVDSIAWGRDNTGVQTTRDEGTYLVQYTNVDSPDETTPDIDWLTLAEIDIQPTDALGQYRHAYEFDTIVATGIRVVTVQDGLAIDELEVFGVATPEPASIAIWCVLGFIGFAFWYRKTRNRS